MVSLFDIRRLLSPNRDTDPVSDFKIIQSWAEYDKDPSKAPEKRNLQYLCYELEVMNPDTGERTHLFKAIRFARVRRLPDDAKQSLAFMDMQEQVLAAVHENQYNLITVIANIIKPVSVGLLFLYGVQGTGKDIDEAKRVAREDFIGFVHIMQGTFRVLRLECAKAEESEWLREKMYNMDYLTVVRGIPKANKAGENAGNKGMGSSNLNPDSQGTIEEIITGMVDYEYVIEILSSPVYVDTLMGWQRQSQKEMTDWYGQLQGQKSLSMSVSIPMMYMANASQASGWSQAYTDANTVSYAQGESFSMGESQSFGQALSSTYGMSVGHTEGSSLTNSFTQGVTETQGVSFGEAFGQSSSVSQGISVGQSTGGSFGLSDSLNQGVSFGEGNSFNAGVSSGNAASYNAGQSTSLGLSETSGQNMSFGSSETTGMTQGQNLSYTEGQTTGSNMSVNYGQNSSLSHTAGTNQSIGYNQSESVNLSNSATVGSSTSQSQSIGQSSSAGYSEGVNSSNSYSDQHTYGGSYNIGSSDASGFTAALFGAGVNASGTDSASIGGSWGDTFGNTTAAGTSAGVSYSNGASQSASISQSSSVSQGASMGYGQSYGLSQNYGINESYGATNGESLSQGWGVNESSSQSVSAGESLSLSNSIGSSASVGSSQSTGQSVNYGQNESAGYSMNTGQNVSSGYNTNIGQNASAGTSQSLGSNYSNSVSQTASTTQGTSYTQNYSENYSVSQSETLGQSVGQSVSDSSTESASQGYTENVNNGQTVTNGSSYTTSNGSSSGTSTGTTGTASLGTSSSMGLSPSIGYNKSYMWMDQGVKDLLELMEYQNERIKKALRGQGAFYTYVYIACPSRDALAAAQALAKSTWQNEFAMVQPLQVLNLTETEQKHLLYHFAAFSADVTKEDVYGVDEYKYCTVLLPEEFVAYTHLPRLNEGGIMAVAQNIPKFAVPSMLDGEIYMGTILSPERYSFENGYNTPYDYRIDESCLMHGFFTGESRSGKTVAAMRFIAELAHIRRSKTGKRLRIVVMDPKQDWRTLARYVEPERFRFYSLGNPNFEPIHLNPWKVPRGVDPQSWIDGVINIYCRAYGLLERGKQMISEIVYELYARQGVFGKVVGIKNDKAVIDTSVEPTADEIANGSAQVTFTEIYLEMEKKRDELIGQGKSGNDTKDAYARLIERLSCFGREYSIETKLYGTSRGIAIDEMIGGDDVTVLESKGLESTFRNFIFGVVCSGFYKWALANEGGYLAKDQFETVLVVEEANQVFTGSDVAGTGSGKQFGMTGESEFEEMIDQAAGYGLFVFSITQKVSNLPASVVANSGIVFAGKISVEEDVKTVVRKVGREERIDDRDLVKWFPRSPIGWFVCRTSRNGSFEEMEPILVKIAMLNVSPPSNNELEEILLEKEAMEELNAMQKDGEGKRRSA